MALRATVEAFDALALLPQSVAGVTTVAFAVAFINAPALDEGLEALLVGSFVNGEVAFGALEVPCGLLEGVLISRLWMLQLKFR